MRPDHDTYFTRMAALVATRATCLRRAVGAVLVNSRRHVLATGYNGVAAGRPHCNEVTGEVANPALDRGDGTYRVAEHWERATIHVFGHACSGANSPSGTNLDGCQAIHAEQNALLQCRDVFDIDTCYVTVSPCIHCTKLLLNTSCRRIVAASIYDQRAASLWTDSGRELVVMPAELVQVQKELDL